jgi:hypothetical protein
MLGSDEEIARRFECLEETQRGGVRPMTCCACFVNRVVVNFLLSLPTQLAISPPPLRTP